MIERQNDGFSITVKRQRYDAVAKLVALAAPMHSDTFSTISVQTMTLSNEMSLVILEKYATTTSKF